jgi:hypothetical protein
LRDRLRTVPAEIDRLVDWRKWLALRVVTNDSDVADVLLIWGDTRRGISRHEELDSAYRVHFRIEDGEYVRSRPARQFLGEIAYEGPEEYVSSLMTSDLLSHARSLVQECEDWLTVAMRDRGIIGAGAKLDDSAVRQLDVKIRASVATMKPSIPARAAPQETGGSKNPLHELARILNRFFGAVWKCHNADTEENRKQTHADWTTEKKWFWSTFSRPAEATRSLADPAITWCSQRGFGSDDSAALVENAAVFITDLARIANPCAMPHVYANRVDAANTHERQGEFLLAADKALLALRQLAGRTGDAWSPESDSPAPTHAELPPEHYDAGSCPGCKAPVPSEYATLPKVCCSACGRWELHTGLSVNPVAGPPGTPPSIVRLHAPLWRPIPPALAEPRRGAQGLPVTPSLDTEARLGATNDADGLDWKALLEAVTDENALAIIEVAQDASKSADDRMRAIYAIDNRVVGWRSGKWSKVLRVTAAAVRQTDWWKTERTRLRG